MRGQNTVMFGLVVFLSAGSAMAFSPIDLKATDFILATENPSLLTWAQGSYHVPVWSLSGGTVGQSVAAVTPPLPKECAGVRVELLVVSQDSTTSAEFTDVFRTHLSQIAPGETLNWKGSVGSQVCTRLPDGPNKVRRIVTESYRRVEPGFPLVVRVQREPGDPNDTFTRPAGLISARITPLAAPPKERTVENSPGYNSWPMMQALGNRLVCAYSRGSGHDIGEGRRGVFARTSTDGGKTWTDEKLVADDPAYGEVTIGKGLDKNGAMLLWVRCYGGPKPHHDLYRTTDGFTFEKISAPTLSPLPMQITDVFETSSGLMSLWFATSYGTDANASWGTLVSTDNGATWTQRTIESGLAVGELPTEQSVVNLGGGRLLGIARTEGGSTSVYSQFQLESTDDGQTWTRTRTNIRDVSASTPSLIYDAKSGLLYNYYYERGRGVLKRRVVRAADIVGHPCDWPAAEVVGFGEEDRSYDAGNVNATLVGSTHYLAYYQGTRTQTEVCVTSAKAVSGK